MMENAAAVSAGFQTVNQRLGRYRYGAVENLDEKPSSSRSVLNSLKMRSSFAATPTLHIRMRSITFCPAAGSRLLNGNVIGLQAQVRVTLGGGGGDRAQYRGAQDELGSSIWGKAAVTASGTKFGSGSVGTERKQYTVLAKAGAVKSPTKRDLDQYMVTLDHPTGIRFARTLSGEIYVDALAKDGNADRARIIMVGDILKKMSSLSRDSMMDVEDFGHTMKAIKEPNGPINLIFERSSLLFRSSLRPSSGLPFNVGRVSVSTWDKKNLVSSYGPSDERDGGSVGFVTYSLGCLAPKALRSLANSTGIRRVDDGYGDEYRKNFKAASRSLSHTDEEAFEVVGLYTDEDMDSTEWTRGNYNKQEHDSALERAENDLCYNSTLGVNYSKITEQIYVGSCIQEENDVHRLVDRLGVTAVLNLQRKSEQENWGIDGEGIERLALEKGLVVVNCPIRDVDAVDLRRKLPYAVGVLYRLLRKGHRVFVTCTTGLDRSPACVIAYMHWIQDVALQEAADHIQKLHPCGPDRPALVWATWDLIAMAEKEDHKGPPTHAVQFVWNHGCRDGEEVLLVGEFKGGWNEPIKAVHASGPKYTVDLRLPQGKYNYKFIVGGHWRHSSSLPTEGDQWGNINNVIKIGNVATAKLDTPHHRPHIKELNSIKVIERPLTEDERFTLAFAARRMAFAIDPFSFASKQ